MILSAGYLVRNNCKRSFADRRGEIDDDQDEADLIREAIKEELQSRGHGNPDEAGVRIPAAEMAKILCSVLNEKLTATAAHEAEGDRGRIPGTAKEQISRCLHVVLAWKRP